jgi:Inosine-uridine preferring nucleoside hydrolase
MMTEAWRADLIHPRARVISDNDYCGDPDGLVQLAHHLLCLSVDIRAVVGSAVAPFHPSWSEDCGEVSAEAARRVAELAGRTDVPVFAGSAHAMPSPTESAPSPGADAIVAEAMRDDTDLPLFVACGGGLTTIASAWLMEPRIAERVTIVWNGGHAYDLPQGDLPSDHRYRETNVNTDLVASQVVFNDSDLSIWQIPQDVFSDVVVSRSEALARIRPHGPLGAHLFEMIGARVDAWSTGLRMGETYALGDCPLVLLTALGGVYDPEPGSSRWVTRPRPRLLDNGLYEDHEDGPPIRVFTHLDVRLLLEDLYGKLAVHAAGER